MLASKNRTHYLGYRSRKSLLSKNRTHYLGFCSRKSLLSTDKVEHGVHLKLRFKQHTMNLLHTISTSVRLTDAMVISKYLQPG